MNRSAFPSKLFGGLFFVVGLIVAIVGTIAISAAKKEQEKCTETAVGSLVRYEERLVKVSKKKGSKTKSSTKLHYFPVFEFTVDGRTYTCEDSSMGKDNKPYELGSTIELHYEPDNPGNNYIIEISGAMKILTLGMGGTFALVGFLVMSGIIKFKR